MKAKRSFRPPRRAADQAVYPTTEDCTDRRAFLGRLGRILVGGAAVAMFAGCSSRPVDTGEGDPRPPRDPNDPYDPYEHMGGMPDIMPAPIDAGPVNGDGEVEPIEPDTGPVYPDATGGMPDTMAAPVDGGGQD